MLVVVCIVVEQCMVLLKFSCHFCRVANFFFLLFARTLCSGRRFADLRFLARQNFLSRTFWTLWARYRHIEYSFPEIDCQLRPVDMSTSVNLYRAQLATTNMNWCFCGAAVIIFIHVLLKFFCNFQELCLWQYTSSLTLLNRKCTMSYLNLLTLSPQVSMCLTLPCCVRSWCWLIIANGVMTSLKYFFNCSLLLSQNSKVLVWNEHYLSI